MRNFVRGYCAIVKHVNLDISGKEAYDKMKVM